MSSQFGVEAGHGMPCPYKFNGNCEFNCNIDGARPASQDVRYPSIPHSGISG